MRSAMLKPVCGVLKRRLSVRMIMKRLLVEISAVRMYARAALVCKQSNTRYTVLSSPNIFAGLPVHMTGR